MMKPLLIILLIVGIAMPTIAQTLNLPQPPPKRDSLVNGIVIGAVVGFLWCTFGWPRQGSENDKDLRQGMLICPPLFALIGAGIDAQHTRRPGVILRVRF